THLSLSPSERMVQATELAGPGWLGGIPSGEALIFCGDLNASPRSKSYRVLRRGLADAQLAAADATPHGTWPARYPFRRIDHIFVSADLDVVRSAVIHNPLTR